MFWFFIWVITVIITMIVIYSLVDWGLEQQRDFREQQQWAIQWKRSSMVWQERALIAELDAPLFVQPLEGAIHVSDDER